MLIGHTTSNGASIQSKISLKSDGGCNPGGADSTAGFVTAG
jgi:hypothetical protein